MNMIHFKRNLKKPNGTLNTTKLWKRYIEKELSSDNLLYLLHLSEDMRNTLLNLKVQHAQFFRGDENFCSVAFRDLPSDEIFDMGLSLENHTLNFFQDFPGHEEINETEWTIVSNIFKKAPLVMYCYYESFYFNKSFDQFNKVSAAISNYEGERL